MEIWEVALSPFVSGTELAKCQCCNRRTIKKDGSGDEDAARSAVHKESRLAEETPKMWKQPKGEDRTEMKKEARVWVCTVLNGSAWITEKKYLSRYKGKCEIFFWCRAQIEEGGNGGAVQQRGKGRMEICS